MKWNKTVAGMYFSDNGHFQIRKVSPFENNWMILKDGTDMGFRSKSFKEMKETAEIYY